jgi:ribonuclease HII
MAATNIDFDRANQFGQEIKAYLNALRKVNQDGPNILTAIVHMVDGDGSDPTHFAELVTKGIYPTNEDAQASYNELASINAKLTTDESVTSVDAAIKQVCSKHGII